MRIYEVVRGLISPVVISDVVPEIRGLRSQMRLPEPNLVSLMIVRNKSTDADELMLSDKQAQCRTTASPADGRPVGTEGWAFPM